MALVAGTGLLLMAVLAPIAHFGVLQSLVVPADAAATVANITASEGSFRFAIAAPLVVAFLDILMAWALYVLLRPVNRTLAMLVGWLRLAAAAAFLPALANLLDVAQLLGGPERSALPAAQIQAQVMSSVASFNNGWDIMLAVFGLHLLGVGALVYRSVQFPRILGVLVVVAGVGYLADTLTRILVPDFAFTFSLSPSSAKPCSSSRPSGGPSRDLSPSQTARADRWLMGGSCSPPRPHERVASLSSGCRGS